MSMKPFIECKNVSVRFPSFRRKTSITGLNEINLSLKAGDRVGLIGSNGAGKSTLLRVMRQVYRPTSGTFRSSGTSVLLAALETAMEGNMTGVENARVLMRYWGIAGDRFDEVMADVHEFTELGNSLYEPLYTYSSGMKLRLAFAMATFQKPEILLLDEIIGVGDANFRAKSAKRLLGGYEQDAILVLASHSSEIIKEHCTQAAVLKQGHLLFFGAVADALEFSKQRVPS